MHARTRAGPGLAPVCKPPRIEGRGGLSAPGLGSLETAKEILTEVFGARLGEIEEMILRFQSGGRRLAGS